MHCTFVLLHRHVSQGKARAVAPLVTRNLVPRPRPPLASSRALRSSDSFLLLLLRRRDGPRLLAHRPLALRRGRRSRASALRRVAPNVGILRARLASELRRSDQCAAHVAASAEVAVNEKTEDCCILTIEGVALTRTRDKRLVDAKALVQVRQVP